MPKDTETLNKISAALGAAHDVTAGNCFGLPCLKVGGKVFAMVWRGAVAFKLQGEAHAEALQVPGAHLFDPRGKGHPMKEWVQIPAEQSPAWSRFARLACHSALGAALAQKDELIQGLVKARRKVLRAANSLLPEQRDDVFLGVWSVKDILAHMAGWDDTNRLAVQEILDGRRPSFWQHQDPDWRRYNARLVAQYRRDEWAELLGVAEAAHRALIALLRTIPAESYVQHQSIASLLRTEARDEEEHARQIEEFRTTAAAQAG
jgi:uncharacterized damage-inducible protein DinB